MNKGLEWTRGKKEQRTKPKETGRGQPCVALGTTHVSGSEEGLLQQGAREAAAQSQGEGCPRPKQLQASSLQALIQSTVPRHEV